MNIWVVKARKNVKGRTQGWHWGYYFDQNEPSYCWGGPEWIRSTYSKKLLRDDVAKDDIIVGYQIDDDTYGRAILGLTRMASEGKDDPLRSGDYNCFDIAASSEAFSLDPPLTIADLFATGCRPKCFGRGTQGTLFPIPQPDFDSIARAIVTYSPNQEHGLVDWLRDAGYENAIAIRPLPLKVAWDGIGDQGCNPGDVDSILDKLEKKYAKRSDMFVARTVRQWIRNDRPLIQALKAKYGYRCQFPGCAASIPMRTGGHYCEVAHVRPVSHGGKSIRLNLLVLCPNHHKLLDYGDLTLEVITRQKVAGLLNGKRFTIHR